MAAVSMAAKISYLTSEGEQILKYDHYILNREFGVCVKLVTPMNKLCTKQSNMTHNR